MQKLIASSKRILSLKWLSEGGKKEGHGFRGFAQNPTKVELSLHLSLLLRMSIASRQGAAASEHCLFCSRWLPRTFQAKALI